MFSEMTRERRFLIEAAAAVLLSQLLILGERAPLAIAGPLAPAMLPLLVFSVRWGVGPGTLICLVSGLLRLITCFSQFRDWWTYLLEQVLSFTLLGTAGLFHGRKKGLLPATATALFLRYGFLMLVACRLRGDDAPATYMYITLSSPTFYHLMYQGIALSMNLCLCMAVFTPLLYPLRRFFTGADLGEAGPRRPPLREENVPAPAEEAPRAAPEKEPELFLFRDRYGTPGGSAADARPVPDWVKMAEYHPQPAGRSGDAERGRPQPSGRNTRDNGHRPPSSDSLERSQMWNRARAPEPEQPKKPNPYQRKERYDPYAWYEKRDRSRAPNRR